MNTHELDELVPARVNPDDWHNLVLGHDRYGKPAGINLRHGAHSRIVGDLRSLVLQRLALSALSRGHEVIWIDTMTQAAEIGRISSWLKEVATSRIEGMAAMLRVLSEVGRRRWLMRSWQTTSWRGLPRSMKVSPLTVIIDNPGDLAWPVDIGLVLNTDDTALVAQYNALYYLQRITRLHSRFGVNVVLGEDSESAIRAPASFSDGLSAHVLAASRSFAAGRLISVMFPRADTERDRAICVLDQVRGLILIGNGNSISAARLAISPSVEAPIILKEIGCAQASGKLLLNRQVR